MVAAVGTIANKGTYVKPRVVKKIINSKTGEVIKEETIFKIYNIDQEKYLNLGGSEELKTKDGGISLDFTERH